MVDSVGNYGVGVSDGVAEDSCCVWVALFGDTGDLDCLDQFGASITPRVLCPAVQYICSISVAWRLLPWVSMIVGEGFVPWELGWEDRHQRTASREDKRSISKA